MFTSSKITTSKQKSDNSPANTDLAEKWDRCYQGEGDIIAAQVLRENRHLLPRTGEALDLACGRGGNALLLAERGLQTWAWDISPRAIEQLNAQTAAKALPLMASVRNVEAEPPTAASFDVIIVSRFLNRGLCAALSKALRPGGLLFYQTFTVAKAQPGGPSNPDYLLANNELLELFADLQLRVYREENCLGDIQQGFRNEALLVAQKPG